MPRVSREPRAQAPGAPYPHLEPWSRGEAGWSARSELLDHGVERAGVAPMAPEDILDVEWGASKTLGYRHHIRRSDKEEHRAWIDEATNEPRTGDAVDFWPGARHPHSSSLSINRRKLGEGNQRKLRLLPCFEPSFQHLRWKHLDVGAMPQLLGLSSSLFGRSRWQTARRRFQLEPLASRTCQWVEEGIRCGSASNRPAVRTSTNSRALRRADKSDKLVD